MYPFFIAHCTKYNMQTLQFISQTATLPITLADVKTHLRVEHSDDDTYITDLITRACELIESETNVDTRSTIWELWLPRFPINLTAKIKLPRGILTSVNSVKYYDMSDTLITWTDFYSYCPAKTLGWVAPKTWFPTAYWLQTNYWRDDAVKINFTTGVGQNLNKVKQAICLLVGTWYENREDETESRLQTLGMGVQRLLDQITLAGVF